MIFFLIFIILPVVEISLFISVGGHIGVFNTLLLCIGAAVGGSILLRFQGFKTLVAMQTVSRRGQVPLQEMFDGCCLALAGVLLMLPGFFTDILAFALMVPPLRSLLRAHLIKRYGFREMTRAEEESVIDAEFTRVDAERIERNE